MLKMTSGLSAVLLISGFGLASLADEASKPAGPGALVVIDAAGKEQKLQTWKFTIGAQRLSWLAPAEKGADKPDKEKLGPGQKPGRRRPVRPAVGPEALVVVDEMKIHFLPGVTTFLPLERLRSIQFDKEKRTMTVRAATSDKPEEDAVFTCTTAYKGLNKVTLKGEVDRGDAGIAEMTYQGGGLTSNLREIRFPEPKAQAEKPGRPVVVVTKDKTFVKTHGVSDLKVLYQLASGRETESPTLMFKKTLKLDVSKIKKITAGSEDADDVVWQVVQKDGDDASLTLLESTMISGGAAKLLGLIGKVPGGYCLFPVRNISTIAFDTSTEPKEPQQGKEKDKKAGE